MDTMKISFDQVILLIFAHLLVIGLIGAAASCSAQQVAPNIIWADATNFVRGADNGEPLATSVRAGLQIEGSEITLSGRPLRLSHPVSLQLENLLTNDTNLNGMTNTVIVPMNTVTWIYLPPTNGWLFLEMTDSKGDPVPKTSVGLALDTQINLKPNTSRWSLPFKGTRNPSFPADVAKWKEVSLFPNEHIAITSSSELDPSRYFVLGDSGPYKLTATLCVYVQNTNTYLKPIMLPPVRVDVRVEK